MLIINTYNFFKHHHPCNNNWEKECSIIQNLSNDYHYYGKPDDLFSMQEALEEAVTAGAVVLIVDNLS